MVDDKALHAQDYVDFERLPLNRDDKGILNTVLILRKMKRALYKSRVVEEKAARAAALHPLVSGLPSEDLGRLWVCEVWPLVAPKLTLGMSCQRQIAV